MNSDPPASPEVNARATFSTVWLIPLATLLIGIWLVIRTVSQQGPEATISFKTAEGITAGKTSVKYKNVEIGQVHALRFNQDFSKVILSVRFEQGMENFLRRGTRFWVVRPQLSVRGVSGLDTLVSGSYLEIEPGEGPPQRDFVGVEKQPVATASEAGSEITLISDRLGSVDVGSTIFYRGIAVGEVLGYKLGSDSRSVLIRAFIREPFDALVRGNSQFWNVSGVDVALGASGVKVHAESMASVLFGGIAFQTPDTLEPMSADISDLVFRLHENYASIAEQAFTRKLKFILYFESSARGLEPGAPVEFKGIKIGSVQDVRLEFDRAQSRFRIPVLVELEPERIVDREAGSNVSPEDTLRDLVSKGMRARLQSGSLLTGQLLVSLDMLPDTPINLAAPANSRYPELPTVPNAIEGITASLERFVAKIDTLEIDRIGANLLGMLEGGNALINSEHTQQTVVELEASMASLRSILGRVEGADVGTVVEAAGAALVNLDKTLVLTQGMIQPNSPLQYNLIKMTGELEEAARAIRALMEMLERRPQSLLFGKDQAQ